jgi:hypothetical protein
MVFTASSCLRECAAPDSVTDSLRPESESDPDSSQDKGTHEVVLGEPSPDLPASWLGTVSRLEIEKH